MSTSHQRSPAGLDRSDHIEASVAELDPATGLRNRVSFLGVLSGLVHLSGRRDPRLGVISIDIDRFKQVNDTMGYQAGDDLLRETAGRILGCVRESDVVARLGGDEFAVLVSDAGDLEALRRLATRILAVIAAPMRIADADVFATASAGIALSDQQADAVELLRDADAAMYRAKSATPGGVAVFEPLMHDAWLDRLRLEEDLRRALRRDELIVHYQPIVDLESGQIRSLEALVRWRHPTKGLLASADFIDVAEEAGLIVEVGAVVIKEACMALARWREATGDATLSVSVNVSPRQFVEPDMVQQVRAAMTRAGIGAGALTLEITETVIMQDLVATVAKMTELKALGIRLAIDDFGTGYSSLSYLRRFPVDILKIDKSFIDDVTGLPEDSALARAIIKLGRTMALRTVAEGIESAEQAAALLRFGCDFGQGYHYAAALPPQMVLGLLLKGRTGGRTGG